jgi:nucleotide-binding universal stress UspA family protein
MGAPVLNLLLAYDGSQHARAAIELLQDLSLAPKSAITLLTVLPTQYITGHEKLKNELEELSNTLSGGRLQVNAELKAGNPAASINDYAREIQADLTLIGAKGLRATLGILLGGVAQQVVEYSCCPVLVVRAPYTGMQRILMVTDGSSNSKEALHYLSRRRCPLPDYAEVHVMHVLPPPITPETVARSWVVVPEAFYPPAMQPVDLDAVEEEEETHGKALLDESLETLQKAGISAHSVMVRGDAATEIIDFIKVNEIDLVVCGSRGLSQVQGWLLGSVSRKLVHYAGCSVLVVKTPDQVVM